MARPFEVPVGERFNMWTVIGPAPHRGTQPHLLCRCDCGVERPVKRFGVLHSVSKNCGCVRRDFLRVAALGHGGTKGGKKTRAYLAWSHMRERCQNPTHPNYRYYGGRGISVCDRWSSFAAFLSDMGEPPPGLSLDRTNNDLGYSPDNCRWATRSEQNLNKRRRGTA